MGIARGFTGNGAQAKTLIGVEARGLQASIVENKRFPFPVFKEKFSVIRAADRVGNEGFQTIRGAVEGVEKRFGGHVQYPVETPFHLREHVHAIQCGLDRNFRDQRGRASKPSAKPLRSTGMPMPSSGVWKTMKVADWPVLKVSTS